MIHSPFRAQNLQPYFDVARKLFASLVGIIVCSGIGELILQISERCMLSCLVSIAIAWASQVAAFGERPVDHHAVQAKPSAQATALIGRVNARSGEPIAGATVSLKEFATLRQASTLSATG